MFQDFDPREHDTTGRGRRSVSAALSLGIFGLIALGVGGAITAHQIHKKRVQEELDVSFEALPKVHAPKPKLVARPQPGAQKAAKAKPVAAPKSIPSERPPEADGELAEGDDSGPIDGVVEQTAPVVQAAPVVAAAPVLEAPPPPPALIAPDQERETIAKPVFVSGCRAPEVPQGLSSSAATIVVDVRLLIGADGRVSLAKIIAGSPLIPENAVLDCVKAQVFEPAHLPDGTAVPYPVKRRYTFRPSQA